jgi:tripartite-type tricarboxylate transporter receptor subunit TctC
MIKIILATIAAFTCVVTTGHAQVSNPWPTKPVRVIVPITAGSAIDIVARAAAQKLSEAFGQPFVVENRPGAGTTIGIAETTRAVPDGYTILFASGALTTTPSTVAGIPYDVMRDLIPVAPLTNTPLVLVTPHAKYKNIADMVAAAKADKGSMNYATNGYGSASHFTAVRFRLAAGFDAQPVMFRGTPEAITEVLADRIGFYFSPMTAAEPLVLAQQIDALATTGRKRSAALPEVPTSMEAGYPDSDFDFWVGLFVPAGTPADVVQRLYQETRKIAESPVFLKEMAGIGGEPLEPMDQPAFAAYVSAELARNAKIAKATGLTPQ